MPFIAYISIQRMTFRLEEEGRLRTIPGGAPLGDADVRQLRGLSTLPGTKPDLA